MWVFVLRVYFNVTFVAFLLVFTAIAHLVHLIGEKVVKSERKTNESMTTVISSWMFWFWFKINPHVRLCGVSKLQADFEKLSSALSAEDSLFLLNNHSSYLDPFLAITMLPSGFIKERAARCMMAANLFQIPVVGKTFQLLGSLPVHFKAQDAK